VAVLDLQAALLSLPGAPGAGAKLVQAIDAGQRDLARQEAQLRTLEQQMASAGKDVPRTLLDSKRADHERRLAAFQRAQRAQQEKLAEHTQVLGPFLREVILAAERVRARRGISIVVDRQQPGATGEDITSAVQQELRRGTVRTHQLPTPGALRRSRLQTQPCAAAVDMDRALRDAKREYDKEHLLDAGHRNLERERDVIDLLLKIERDRLRREQGYIALADLQFTLAVAPGLPDVTEPLVRRFVARYGRLGAADFAPRAPGVQGTYTPGSSACYDIIDRVCSRPRADVDACAAAKALSSHASVTVCELAIPPLESLPAAPDSVGRLEAPGNSQPTSTPANASACARLVDTVCSESGPDSEDCKQIRATSKQLSSAACSLVLRTRTPSPK